MLSTMFTFLVVVTVLVWALLITTTSMQPQPSIMSRFELERRAKRSEAASKELHREKLLPDVLTLKRLVTALLLVASVLLSVVTFGWAIGIVVAVAVALLYGAIARWRPLVRATGKLYASLEPGLLHFIETAEPVFAFLREAPLHDADAYHRFDSREELEQLISQAEGVLSDNERRLMTHTLQFSERTVSEIMTAREAIVSIKKSEMLGPLVLDELHKQGHSRIPVTGKDVNHIVGILYLRDLLALDVKRSTTAEKAMDTKVFYIRQDDTLEHALAAFLKLHHLLFVVINDQRETVGVLSLEDIIEALVGRAITDEDDIHHDAVAVAASKTADNNLPPHHVEV